VVGWETARFAIGIRDGVLVAGESLSLTGNCRGSVPEILTSFAEDGGETAFGVPTRVRPIGEGDLADSLFGVVARDGLVEDTGRPEADLAGTETTRLPLLGVVLPTPQAGRGGCAFFVEAAALTSAFPRGGLGVFVVGALLVLRDCWGIVGGGRFGGGREEELERRPILEGVGRTAGDLVSTPFVFAVVGVEGVGRVGFAGVDVVEAARSSAWVDFVFRGAREEDRFWIAGPFFRGGVARDIAAQRGLGVDELFTCPDHLGVADRWAKGRAEGRGGRGQRRAVSGCGGLRNCSNGSAIGKGVGRLG
jgi:hypothetical protein